MRAPFVDKTKLLITKKYTSLEASNQVVAGSPIEVTMDIKNNPLLETVELDAVPHPKSQAMQGEFSRFLQSLNEFGELYSKLAD